MRSVRFECAGSNEVFGLNFEFYIRGVHCDEILITLGGLRLGDNFELNVRRAS
jgi:hypothetical protein